MRERRVFTEQLHNGPEIEFQYQPIEDTLLQLKVGDRHVVAYLVQDEGYHCNPLKEFDGNGSLYTYKEGVITDDNSAPANLGLNSFGYRDFDPDLSLDAVYVAAYQIIKKKIESDEALRVLFVAAVLEFRGSPEAVLDALPEDLEYGTTDASDAYQTLLDELGSWEQYAEPAWQQAYAAGEIGEYLAVPVQYDDYGSSGTRIYTSSIDDCNAVWVPGKDEIQNMNFTGCTTYLQRLAVAEKYAENCLSEYEKWCNGEVYGCVVEVFDEQGKKLDARDEECWGFIGNDRAEEALKDTFTAVCKYMHEQYVEEVL